MITLILHKKTGESFECYIDDEDFNKVKDYSWHLKHVLHNNSWYAKATIYLGMNKNKKSKSKVIYMSRLIMGLTDTDERFVDHKNHNTLDNRKCNLRMITNKQNLRNRKSKNKNNTSGYRNVCFMNNYYRIQLQINGTNYLFPEKFKNVHKAGEFAEKMRKKYYKEFAGKN